MLEMSRHSIAAVRRTFTSEDLASRGYDSPEDLLRDEFATAEGAGGGFFDGINGTSSLNLGLNEEGRRIFRQSTRAAIDRLYPEMRDHK
jgi:hypothetical protein